MALVFYDRVQETSTTTGTGTLTLAGAVSGYQAFSAIGNGNTCYYVIEDRSTGAWETGIGTYTLSGTTLARTTVRFSSNSNSAVSFAAGTKYVSLTYSADACNSFAAAGASAKPGSVPNPGASSHAIPYYLGDDAAWHANAAADTAVTAATAFRGPSSGSAAAATFRAETAADIVPAGYGGHGGLINCTLAASVSGNALTIALKTYAGTDATADDPIRILFRSSTAATGTWTERTVTAANSLVISSGSLMGTSNSTAFRLWIVIFDDAGTLRLGAVNAVPGNVADNHINFFNLREDLLLSSTAEGGSGGADSALLMYTGTAVTSKAFRILGYMEWSTGLATAGTWSAGPSIIQMFGPGVSIPGQIVQRQMQTDFSIASGTTLIPADDTIPQNSEGTQFITCAITPTSKANILRITADCMFSCSANAQAMVMALFQDSTADALRVVYHLIIAGEGDNYHIDHYMLSSTVSSTTFKIRAGGNQAATFYFNSYTSTRLYGGKVGGQIVIEELQG